MYSDGVLILGVLILIWLLGLTFAIWQSRNFLQSLFPKSGERDIRKKFEEMSKMTVDFNKRLSNFDQQLSRVEKDGLRHIQQVELLRFNPYNDTGGDQSFAATLLDKSGNGLVLTSLHARAGTRVFAKPVKGGKALKYQFSQEEETVVRKAMEN